MQNPKEEPSLGARNPKRRGKLESETSLTVETEQDEPFKRFSFSSIPPRGVVRFSGLSCFVNGRVTRCVVFL